MRRLALCMALSACTASPPFENTSPRTVRVEATRAQGPAELPPPGYKAAQYVDSRGCVFIRAGFAGAVEWVPRVDRKGGQLCGLKPS